MENTIEFSKVDFKKFKSTYNKAVKLNKVEFLFLKKVFVTSYAKYLIEYLKDKFDD